MIKVSMFDRARNLVFFHSTFDVIEGCWEPTSDWQDVPTNVVNEDGGFCSFVCTHSLLIDSGITYVSGGVFLMIAGDDGAELAGQSALMDNEGMSKRIIYIYLPA